MTRLEKIALLVADQIATDTGVDWETAAEAARNGVCGSDDPLVARSLEQGIAAALQHRLVHRPETWRAIAFRDIDTLARRAADAALGGGP